jgi:hypothetical protein
MFMCFYSISIAQMYYGWVGLGLDGVRCDISCDLEARFLAGLWILAPTVSILDSLGAKLPYGKIGSGST